jgi:Raf kinase inhibitor-like YbhB/YbcL family protein
VRAGLATLLLLALIVACDSGEGDALPEVDGGEQLTVDGPFEDGDPIPAKFTCDGDEVSPALEWTVVPEVREYALIMSDPDAPGGTFVHWVVWGLPAGGRLEEGELPADALEGTNDTGEMGYAGPCPPEGDDPHRYELTVYGLGSPATSELEPGAAATELLEAIECCIEASGTLTGTYARP